jgi:3-phenylpropionate/trans-cinnamate dioxygenase ferredoxin subunit
MAQFAKVASLWDLPPGKRMAIWLNGVRIMLVNVDGEIFAVSEQCTHMEGSLMDAPLRGTIIGCPRHLAAFDLRDGRVIRGPATVPLPTYEVKIEGGDIHVEEPPIEAV